MTIIEKIKVLANKGARGIIMHPDDLTEIKAQCETATDSPSPYFTITITSSELCQRGEVYPAPKIPKYRPSISFPDNEH